MSRRALFLTALLPLLAAGGWYVLRPVPVVEATQPERGPAIDAVYATGTVEPEVWADVAAVVAGRVSEVLVQEGDAVTAGQPLVRLEESEARARVSELQARVSYTAAQLDRQKALSGQGFASREALAKAKSDHLQATAALNQSRQKLVDLTIPAPMTGIVLRRDIDPGEVVDKQKPILWIGQAQPLRITAEVDEEDIPRVRVGQPVAIKADAFPNQVFEGTVAQITPKGDPITKTFRVRVRVPESCPVLVGMTTEVNIITQRQDNAMLVPATAVVDGRVWVVEADQVQTKPVSVGIKGRTKVQVLDGLSGQERVVRDPPAGLAAGDKVRLNGKG